MPLAFLLDENLRHRLTSALTRHNQRGMFTIDFVQVGDPDDLPLRSLDRVILAWADREGRILVSFDRATLVAELIDRLAAGGTSPGIFLLRPGRTLAEIVGFLPLAAHASLPDEYRDRAVFIPSG
jgi:predicted nuclease of predicted toxin-antitoxin system